MRSVELTGQHRQAAHHRPRRHGHAAADRHRLRRLRPAHRRRGRGVPATATTGSRTAPTPTRSSRRSRTGCGPLLPCARAGLRRAHGVGARTGPRRRPTRPCRARRRGTCSTPAPSEIAGYCTVGGARSRRTYGAVARARASVDGLLEAQRVLLVVLGDRRPQLGVRHERNGDEGDDGDGAGDDEDVTRCCRRRRGARSRGPVRAASPRSSVPLPAPSQGPGSSRPAGPT